MKLVWSCPISNACPAVNVHHTYTHEVVGLRKETMKTQLVSGLKHSKTKGAHRVWALNADRFCAAVHG